MKKTKAGATSAKKPARTTIAAKKSAPRAARTRPSSQQAVAMRTKEDQGVLGALTELVEISVEIRELLAQIRDALVEGEEAESEEVDTVIIAEAESPELSEEEL